MSTTKTTSRNDIMHRWIVPGILAGSTVAGLFLFGATENDPVPLPVPPDLIESPTIQRIDQGLVLLHGIADEMETMANPTTESSH